MAVKQPSQRAWRVLVVDDKPDEAEALLRHLRQQGWDVLFSHSGENALKLIAAHRPDAIVCDLQMPGLDGYKVLEAIGNNSQTHSTPFLLTNATWTMHNWSRPAGGRTADCHIWKPYGENELRGIVCLLSRMFQRMKPDTS